MYFCEQWAVELSSNPTACSAQAASGSGPQTFAAQVKQILGEIKRESAGWSSNHQPEDIGRNFGESIFIGTSVPVIFSRERILKDGC